MKLKPFLLTILITVIYHSNATGQNNPKEKISFYGINDALDYSYKPIGNELSEFSTYSGCYSNSVGPVLFGRYVDENNQFQPGIYISNQSKTIHIDADYPIKKGCEGGKNELLLASNEKLFKYNLVSQKTSQAVALEKGYPFALFDIGNNISVSLWAKYGSDDSKVAYIVVWNYETNDIKATKIVEGLEDLPILSVNKAKTKMFLNYTAKDKTITTKLYDISNLSPKTTLNLSWSKSFKPGRMFYPINGYFTNEDQLLMLFKNTLYLNELTLLKYSADGEASANNTFHFIDIMKCATNNLFSIGLKKDDQTKLVLDQYAKVIFEQDDKTGEMYIITTLKPDWIYYQRHLNMPREKSRTDFPMVLSIDEKKMEVEGYEFLNALNSSNEYLDTRVYEHLKGSNNMFVEFSSAFKGPNAFYITEKIKGGNYGITYFWSCFLNEKTYGNNTYPALNNTTSYQGTFTVLNDFNDDIWVKAKNGIDIKIQPGEKSTFGCYEGATVKLHWGGYSEGSEVIIYIEDESYCGKIIKHSEYIEKAKKVTSYQDD